MFKKLKLKKNIIVILLPLLLIVSLILFFVNNVFHYSELRPTIEVTYSFKESSKVNEVLDKTVALTNVSKVQRSVNRIEFQWTNKDEVKNNIQNIVKDYPETTFVIKEISETKRFAISSLVGAFYLIFLASAAIHFYFNSSKGGELRLILGSYLAFGLALTVAGILNLGLLSLLSRFYKITLFDITLTLLSSITLFCLYYVNSGNLNDINTFSFLGSHYRKYVSENFKNILLVIFLLISITTFGLGISFVVPAFLIIIFIAIAFAVFYWMGYIMENHVNLQLSVKQRFDRIRSLRTKKLVTPAQTQNTSKKKDKKSKKKKR